MRTRNGTKIPSDGAYIGIPKTRDQWVAKWLPLLGNVFNGEDEEELMRDLDGLLNASKMTAPTCGE